MYYKDIKIKVRSLFPCYCGPGYKRGHAPNSICGEWEEIENLIAEIVNVQTEEIISQVEKRFDRDYMLRQVTQMFDIIKLISSLKLKED